VYAVLIYGFPLILLLFEWGLRTVLVVESWGFTGPTLSAAGLSFLVPLTKPKVLNVQVPNQPNAVVTSTADRQFVALVWLFVLAYLFAWSASCYVSIKTPDHKVIGLSTHLVIGGAAYLLSLLMTFIKEKV
jgi:hypothetical protein